MPSAMLSSRKLSQIMLLGLIVLLVGWDLWVILVDQRVSLNSDSVTWAFLGVRESGPCLFADKAPLATLLSFPLEWLLGRVPLATRLLSVLCHGVIVLLTYSAARRAWQTAGTSEAEEAGLMAAALCGMTPMVCGWSRMDFPDITTACLVIGTLRLMLDTDLDRLWPSLRLGLVLALGLITKLSFPVYMLFPGAWFALTRVRTLREARNLGLIVLLLVAVLAAWITPHRETFWVLLVRSTSDAPETIWSRVVRYAADPSIMLSVVLGTAMGIVLLRRSVRGSARRWNAWLFGLALCGPMVLFCVVFDHMYRYLLGIYPVAAVLTAGGLTSLLRQLPPGRRRAVIAGLAVVLLGSFLWTNLRFIEQPHRDHGTGIITPARGDYLGYPRALAALRPHGQRYLEAWNTTVTQERCDPLRRVWRYRGVSLKFGDIPEADTLLRQGRPVPVLFIVEAHEQPRLDKTWFEQHAKPRLGHGRLDDKLELRFRWLAAQKRRELFRTKDDYGLIYVSFLVLPPTKGSGS